MDKTQNKCAMVSDGFVFMYMLNPVIGSAEQKSDLCYTMWGPHLGGGCGGLLPSVDSRLCWISDIVFDQGAVMPKLTPLTTSNKCLRTIKLGFICDRSELIRENKAYIPKCSAIDRICGILTAR